MSIEKRRYPRVYRRASVEFMVEEKTFDGILINFSEAGLFIETESIFPIGTEVTVPLKLRVGEHTLMKGYVVWARHVTDQSKSFLQSGIGVQLLAVPDEYLQFVRHCAKDAEKHGRAHEERFEIYHRVEVGQGDAVTVEYTENISKSGMFLVSAMPFPPNMELQLKIEIHGLSRPIEVLGKVAYVLTHEEAKKSGRSAGLGIKFLDMDETSASLWNFHLKRLETHRTTRGRKREADIPSRGSLWEVSVPEILIDLLRRQFTGELLLQRKSINKIIYFKNGHPVFVESNLYTETLGNFLVRRNILTDSQLLDSLETFARSDLQYGEVLIASDLINANQLASSLVEHQEEKLANTFSWFEGTYELIEDQEWSQKLTILPLRVHKVVFEGIARWYDPNILSTWMGLDELVSIKTNFVQMQGYIIPADVQKLLIHCRRAESIGNLGKKMRYPTEKVIQLAYGLVILGWISFDYSGPNTKDESVTPQPSAIPENELLFIIKKWIDDDFDKLKNLNFYELLGIDEAADEQEVTRAYLYQYSRYNSYELDQITSADLLEKLSQIRSWIRLSYDILKDPHLRSGYKNREKKTADPTKKNKRIESERVLLESMKAIELGNFAQAKLQLEAAIKTFPEHVILPGYLGWCLFQLNPKENRKRAVELIDQTLEKEDQDALLHYYRAEIHFFQNEWQSAEYHFAQATRLKPGFMKAQVACEVAKEKRVQSAEKITVIK